MSIEQLMPFLLALIPVVPLYYRMLSEKKKTTADASETLVKTALELLERLQGRVDALETDAQKKIDEVNCLTEERDDLRVEVEALRKEVDELRKEVEALRRENKVLKKALKGDAVSAPPYIEKGG